MRNLLLLLLLCSQFVYSQSFKHPADKNFLPIQLKGACGYIDTTGKIVIEPRFEEAGYFSEGYACVLSGGKWGYIDSSGKEVIVPQFDDIADFYQGIARVKKEGKICFINKSDRILHCQERYSFPYRENRLPIQKGNKWGYMDSTGKEVITPVFEMTGSFSHGLAAVLTEDYAYGFMDREGKWVIKPQFENAGNFIEGLAVVSQVGKWGYIDTTGNFIIPPQFAYIEPFVEGIAMVKKLAADGGHGDPFDESLSEQEKLFGTQDGKFVFIDKTGKLLCGEQEFDQAHSFSNGYAPVMRGKKWGYIDTTGKVVIPLQYDYVSLFYGNIAWVEKNDRVMFIDRQGKIQDFPVFDDVSSYHNGFFVVFKDGKFDGKPDESTKIGYMNAQGKVIWEPTN